MELKRVILNVVKYHFTHLMFIRTPAYLDKVAEKYSLLQRKQQSHMETVWSCRRYMVVLELSYQVRVPPITTELLN